MSRKALDDQGISEAPLARAGAWPRSSSRIQQLEAASAKSCKIVGVQLLADSCDAVQGSRTSKGRVELALRGCHWSGGAWPWSGCDRCPRPARSSSYSVAAVAIAAILGAAVGQHAHLQGDATLLVAMGSSGRRAGLRRCAGSGCRHEPGEADHGIGIGSRSARGEDAPRTALILTEAAGRPGASRRPRPTRRRIRRIRLRIGPGLLRAARTTFYVGHAQGRPGRIFAASTLRRYLRQGRLRQARDDRKTPLTAADLLNDRVIPLLRRSVGIPLHARADRPRHRILRRSPRPPPNTSSIWQVEDIDHTRTKAKSPQTNGIVEAPVPQDLCSYEILNRVAAVRKKL